MKNLSRISCSRAHILSFSIILMLSVSMFLPIGEALYVRENVEGDFEWFSSFLGDLLECARIEKAEDAPLGTAFADDLDKSDSDVDARFAVSSTKPDLVVTEIDLTPDSPYEVGDTIFFTAHIKNQGPVSTEAWGPFDVSYWIDSDYLNELNIDVIDAGQTIYRSFEWTADSDGWHTVKFHVDYFDFIPESNQDNNDRSEDFYVEPTGPTEYPDLVVTEIDITPGSSDDVFFTAYIKNQGPVSTVSWGSFDAKFWVDGVELCEPGIDEIDAGEIITKTCHWYDGPGEHTIRVCVDYYDFIPESKQDNNCREESYTIEIEYPDLTVTDISWTPSSPEEGDTITFTVYIKNQGPVDTSAWGSFDVPYYIDALEEGEWIIDNIEAGETLSKQFLWTATAGSHTVSAYADKGGFIPEGDENNNEREESFTVPSIEEKADLIITEISWTPSSPIEGDTLTLTVYIKNQGPVDTSAWGPFDIQYYIDDVNEGEWIIDNIGAGQAISRSFDWYAGSSGWHTVCAYADKGGFIPESDETNNERCEDSYVQPPTLNEPPTAYIDSISPNPASEGEIVYFEGHGYDSDGDIVEYRWKSSRDGYLSNQASFSKSDLSVGMHTLYFKVKDDDGDWSSSDTETLTIEGANVSPTAYIDSISPNSATEGETVYFSGHGSDTDGYITAYRWDSSIDGFLSSSDSFSTSSLSIGTHTISFKVKDDADDWSSPDTETLRIESLEKPTAYIDSISPASAEEGETVYFEGHGYDPDGYLIGYRWESSRDGYLSDHASFSTSSLSVGTHTISFKVKDDDYQWSNPTTRTLTVSSPPPPELSITDVYFDNLEIGGTSEIRIMIKNVGEGPFSGGSHYFYFTIKDADGSTFEGYIRRHLGDPDYEKVIQSGRSKRKVNLPSLAPGERERVTFYVDPDPLTSPSLTFSNRLYVSFAPSIPSSGTRYRDYEPSDVITFSTGQIYECASFAAKLLLAYLEVSEFLDPKLAKVLNKYVPSLTIHRSALVRLFSEKPVSFSQTAIKLVEYLRHFARALSEAYSGSDFLAKLKSFAWNLFLEIGGRGAICGINMLHWALQVVLKAIVELVQSAILTLTEAVSVFADIIEELGGSITDLLALLSPADVLLRDEAGRVAGYYDGTVYEQIDGSIVIVEEEEKFIFVPTGTYDVVINGTGSGDVHCYMILTSGNTTFMTQHELTVDFGTAITGIFGDQEQVALTKHNATKVTQVLPKASASVVKDQTVTTLTANVFVWMDNQPHLISVESNAAISTPTYNEQTCEISFAAYGPTGSNWQMKVTIPSTLLQENPILQVYVNGNRIDASVAYEADNYVVDFAGHFSIVDITVRATSSTVPEPFWVEYQLWIVGGITGVILVLTAMFFATKKRKSVLKEKP